MPWFDGPLDRLVEPLVKRKPGVKRVVGRTGSEWMRGRVWGLLGRIYVGRDQGPFTCVVGWAQQLAR